MVKTCPLVKMKPFILMLYIRQWSTEPENVIAADSHGKQTESILSKGNIRTE